MGTIADDGRSVRVRFHALPDDGSTTSRRSNANGTIDIAYIVQIVEQEQTATQAVDARKDHRNKGSVLILALDISGSMSGSPLNQSKEAILKMLSRGSESEPCLWDHYSSVIFITYHSRIETSVQLFEHTYRDVVSSQRAMGGTNFIIALQEIEQHVKSIAADRPAQCVFLSDGQHNEGGDVHAHVRRMREQYQERSQYAVVFHCLGFSADHDVNLLQSLVSMGNAQGSFQYAANVQELQSCLGTLLPMLCDIAATPFLEIDFIKEAPMSADGGDATSGQFDKPICEKKRKRIRIGTPQVVPSSCRDAHAIREWFNSSARINDGDSLARIVDVCAVTDAEEQLDLELHAIDLELLRMAQQLEQREQVSTVQLAHMDTRLTSLINEDKRFRSNTLAKTIKTKIFERVKMLKERVAAIYGMSKQLAKQQRIDKHELATLLSSSFDFITKTGLKKKLDKRVGQNLDLFERMDKAKSGAELQLLKRGDDMNAVPNVIPRESLETFRCALSTCNWAELVQQCNSIGVGCRMSRTQAAIADPCQLRIHEITPTLLSCNDFLNSVQFRLEQLADLHPEGEGEEQQRALQQEIHGGFARSAGTVLTGTARETINGLIPLYIHKDHWAMARNDLQPVFGWMTTLDVFGYSDSQRVGIPLVALASFLSMEEWSEMHAILFLAIWRTCRVLIYDNIQSRHRHSLPDYSDAINRMPDKISNNNVVLAKLLVDPTQLNTWNMTLNEFLLALLEEDVRRSSRTLGDEYDIAVLADKMKLNELVRIRTDFTPSELHDQLVQYEQKKQVIVANLEAEQEQQELGEAPKCFEEMQHSLDAADNLFQELLARIGGTKRYARTMRNFAEVFTALTQEFDLCQLQQQMDDNFGLAPREVVHRLCAIINGSINDKYSAQDNGEVNADALDLFLVDASKPASAAALPAPLTARQVQALLIQSFDHRNHSARREALSSPSTYLNPFVDSETIVDVFVQRNKHRQISRINNLCEKSWNFDHRFEKFDIDVFLARYTDQLAKCSGAVEWLSVNRDLLRNVKFYNVQNENSFAVCQRRDILRVEESDVLKELVFTDTTNRVILCVTSTMQRVDATSLGKLMSRNSSCTSVTFPEKEIAAGLLPSGISILSVPLWIANVERDMCLCIDKAILVDTCHTGVYGASGVPGVLSFYPTEVLQAVAQQKQQKGEPGVVAKLKHYI